MTINKRATMCVETVRQRTPLPSSGDVFLGLVQRMLGIELCEPCRDNCRQFPRASLDRSPCDLIKVYTDPQPAAPSWRSDPPENQENDNDAKDQSKAAHRGIAPLPAV